MKYWKNINRLVFGSVIVIGLCLVWLRPVQAVITVSPSQCGSTTTDGKDVFLKNINGQYTLEQPLGAKTQVANVGEYVSVVYRYALGMVGILATVLIMAGGLIWLSSAGNEQMITQGKEIITSALVGLVIALFSYSILYWINPQFTSLNMEVFKIPVPKEIYQCTNVPTVIPISTKKGLNGGDETACSGVDNELQWIANNVLPSLCANCTLYISDGFRTGDEQADLYHCYQEKQSTGTCPASCDGQCNEATKPCCGDHNKGLAVDVCLIAPGGNTLQSGPYAGAIQSSCPYMKEEFNNGGSGANAAALKANQDLLKAIMTQGNFSPYSGEWWHFTYKGQCNQGTAIQYRSCTQNPAMPGTATDFFCIGDYQKSHYDPASGNVYRYYYAPAGCDMSNKTNCDSLDPTVSQSLSPKKCVQPRTYVFDSAKSLGGSRYATEPTCQ